MGAAQREIALQTQTHQQHTHARGHANDVGGGGTAIASGRSTSSSAALTSDADSSCLRDERISLRRESRKKSNTRVLRSAHERAVFVSVRKRLDLETRKEKTNVVKRASSDRGQYHHNRGAATSLIEWTKAIDQIGVGAAPPRGESVRTENTASSQRAVVAPRPRAAHDDAVLLGRQQLCSTSARHR